MTTAAQYASIPKEGNVSISTANPARDGTGTLGICFTANNVGSRIDRIESVASGTTTQNVLRFFITQGTPGLGIVSITFSGTTATVTTNGNHGLSTGNLVTLQGNYPNDYNVTAASCSVVTATTFIYTMATTPTTNAVTVGYYSYTPATPVTKLWREVLVNAVTPSTSTAVFSSFMASNNSADIGYLPLNLPAGYSLRVSTNNAEGYNVFANGGDQ